MWVSNMIEHVLMKGNIMQHNKYYQFIGEQLRQCRVNKNLSLQDVADRVGLTRMTIANYETARTRIPFDVAKRLCQIYDIDFNDLMVKANQYL